MAEAATTLRVLRRGERLDDLLAKLAQALGRDEIRPDDNGLIVLRINDRAPRAWDSVREALDAVSQDWREWLYLAPRPPR
jgi:hypothetical protein